MILVYLFTYTSFLVFFINSTIEFYCYPCTASFTCLCLICLIGKHFGSTVVFKFTVLIKLI